MSQKRIVLTGGPGAGKTAVIEVVRIAFDGEVTVLPESASILFGGGFPRREGLPARRAAQRAIFRVQRELEAMAEEEATHAVALCDRGTLDGLAYWPGDPDSFWASAGTSLGSELDRYAAVIHLRSPPATRGYNHKNPVRTESPEEAMNLDARILDVWAPHPTRVVIDSTVHFVDKVEQALRAIRQCLGE